MTTTQWANGQQAEMSWTSFGSDSASRTVRLQYSAAITSYTIRPSTASVSPIVSGNQLTLTVPAGAKLYIVANGDTRYPVMVWSDPIAATTPVGAVTFNAGTMASGAPSGTVGSPAILKFPAGIHTLPTTAGSVTTALPTVATREFASTLWRVGPYTEIWLERGAWVVGSLDLRQSNDVVIRGPGVLSGEWCSDADWASKVQGAGNVHINPGQPLTFEEQLTFGMVVGRFGGDGGDSSFPSMSMQDVTIVGGPFYTFGEGISSCSLVKVVTPWFYNCDGMGLSVNNAPIPTRTIDRCFVMAGDDGLVLAGNDGVTTVTDTYVINTQAANIVFSYFNLPSSAATTYTPSTLVEGCTFTHFGLEGDWGGDLYTGAQAGAYQPFVGYSAPASLTSSILKTWVDGSDNDPAGWGRHDVVVRDCLVDGPIPQALLTLENAYYPFLSQSLGGTLISADKAGSISSFLFDGLTTTHVPARMSRIIGRDRLNTPHDITFNDVVIAGTLVTPRNYESFFLQHWAPYNIFVEGRCVVTALDICNLALAHIGESAAVQSISPPDGSAQSLLCVQFYNRAVDELLEMHAWSFATARVALTTTPSNEVDGWGYSYVYPPSVLKTLQVIPEGMKDRYVDQTTREPYEYTIEQNAAGSMVLYTDVEEAELRYTKFVYTPGYYPPLFITSLSWMLASKLAGPILKGDVGAAEAKRCLQMVQFYIGKAAASDANQRRTDTSHTAPWISGR
jgi:hypothetical protein